jgi:hypothetical protein
MKLVPDEYRSKVSEAVRHYWYTLFTQAAKKSSKDADRGRRAAVTGGKQMDGFCELLRWLFINNGLQDADINLSGKSELAVPGFYRPTKQWDILAVHNKCLLAAVEFKSQRGPSFGNNFNNRTEEALGTAEDLWTAYREGSFGKNNPKPWAGWLMLLEDCDKSKEPVGVVEHHFLVRKEFKDTSYAKRYELLLRKLVLEKKYDAAAFIMATQEGGLSGQYSEPASDISIKRFLASLAGHIRTYIEGI